MKFNEIMQMNIFELEGVELEFHQCHERVMSYGQMMSDNLVMLAKNLSEMKEKELFKAAGFSTFGEYAENAVGLRQAQAYKYAAIYENLPEDFFHSSGKIGVTKLALLSGLTDDKREEIIAENDVEKVSVSELQRLIAEKDEKLYRLQSDYNDLNNDFIEMEKSGGNAEELQSEIDELKKDLEYTDSIKTKLEAEIEDLKSQPQQIEEKVIEKTIEVEKVVEDTESKEKLLKAKDALKIKTQELDEYKTKLADLEKKLATSSEGLTKFKVKFKDLQACGSELFSLMASLPEEEKAKCINAMKTVIEGWNL